MSIDIDKVRIPTKVDSCPIIEATVEFRFNPSVADDDFIGVVYGEFNKDYPILRGLPGLQIPRNIGKDEKSLLYVPHYKLSSKDGKNNFQVGPKSFSLMSVNPYEGWASFSKRIEDVTQRMKSISIFDAYTRLGIRYANKFNADILKGVDMSLSIRDNKIVGLETNINFTTKYDIFTNNIIVSNNVSFHEKDQTSKGSLIDIDTYVLNPEGDIMEVVNKAHSVEKKLFFTILRDDFIEKELKPTY